MKNGKLTEDQRKKWLGVITNEFMSSEESEDETIIVRPLPWRSEYVNEMFRRLDLHSNSKKSPQAKRQMKERISGSPSSRPSPNGEVGPWALRKV